MGAHGFLLADRRFGQGDLGLPDSLERVVIAGIIGQPFLLHMQDAGHDGIEEVALVADQNHGFRIAAQKPFQPQRGFEIQMVGRLVQQQHIRFGEQGRRQGNAHAPAAGIAAHRPLLHCMVETKAVEDDGGARRGGMGANIVQPGLDFADAHRVCGGFRFGQQGGALRIGGQHQIDRQAVAALHLLRDGADAAAARQGDPALIGFVLAQQQLQQGGFARTVAADQADPVALGNPRQCAFENAAAAEAEGQV